MQVALAALAPPAALTGEPVKFNCEVPDVLPSAASLTPLGLLGADGAAAAADAPVATGAAAPPAAAAAAPAADGAPAESQGRNKKAEKEAKKAAKGDKPKKEAAPAAEAVRPAQPDASKLDLRVGLILKAEKHPEAEKLYVEQVDLGEGKLRTVVSGLVDFMPPEALTNRRAVLICNLKPAKMRGVESEAMVLAASDVEHTKVELLDLPAAAAIGERVTFEGLGEFGAARARVEERNGGRAQGGRDAADARHVGRPRRRLRRQALRRRRQLHRRDDRQRPDQVSVPDGARSAAAGGRKRQKYFFFCGCARYNTQFSPS